VSFKEHYKFTILHYSAFIVSRLSYAELNKMYKTSVFNRFTDTPTALKGEKPVGGDCCEVEDEIVVDKLVGMLSETLLMLKRSYCAAACDRFTEMNVDR